MCYTGCSDDDNDSNSIMGTWKIATLEQEDWYEFNGATVTFEEKNLCKFSNGHEGDYKLDAPYYYELKGAILKISYGKGNEDDYYLGTIKIEGNKATYIFQTQNMIDDDDEEFITFNMTRI